MNHPLSTRQLLTGEQLNPVEVTYANSRYSNNQIMIQDESQQ